MYVNEIKNDEEIAIAYPAFSTTCTAKSTDLHLMAVDMAAIEAAATNFNDALQAVIAAKQAYHEAIVNKEAVKAASKAVVCKYVRKFRSDLTITDSLLALLNVAPHTPAGVVTPAVSPTSLAGTIEIDGAVKLTWSRGSNIYPTTFIVESQSSPTGPWSLVGTTTKTKFDTSTPVGQYIAFRVTAVRGNSKSAPSAPFGFFYSSTVELPQAA